MAQGQELPVTELAADPAFRHGKLARSDVAKSRVFSGQRVVADVLFERT
jgi:hypothetical protein